MRLRASQTSGLDRLPESERRSPENASAYPQQGQEPGLSAGQGHGQDLQEQEHQQEAGQQPGKEKWKRFQTKKK